MNHTCNCTIGQPVLLAQPASPPTMSAPRSPARSRPRAERLTRASVLTMGFGQPHIAGNRSRSARPRPTHPTITNQTGPHYAGALPPRPTAPVDQTNQPQMTRPLCSTPITGASPLLRAGPPARCQSAAVRLPRFHASAADQAHAASVPDTTWPVIGHPPGPAPAARSMATVSMPRLNVTTRQQRFGFTHLPGPHLTPHWCLFHIAHHDGLQPTQHMVVWSLPPKGDSEGPTFIARTAPTPGGLPYLLIKTSVRRSWPTPRRSLGVSGW